MTSDNYIDHAIRCEFHTKQLRFKTFLLAENAYVCVSERRSHLAGPSDSNMNKKFFFVVKFLPFFRGHVQNRPSETWEWNASSKKESMGGTIQYDKILYCFRDHF